MQGGLFCQHWIMILSRAAIIHLQVFMSYSPTDFMSYSIFQLLTKYLAGAILPIYCREHLRKHNKNSSYNIPQLKKKKEAGNNVISSISNRNIFTFPDSVLSLPWTELLS